MIRIERIGLPPGMNAFARRENGTVFVYVSEGLSAGERLAAIREVLRAAPDAGWRTGHHPVLLPALAGGAGLRRAPEGRWTYWALLTAAIAVAASVVAVTVLSAAATPQAAAVPPVAQSRSGPSGARPSPGPGHVPRTSGGSRSSPAPPGSRPGPSAQRKTRPGAPKPQASGRPVPVPAGSTAPSPQPPPARPSPQPSSASSPGPAPGPSPSPSPPQGSPGSQGSPGVCVVVLGVTICL